MLKNHRRTFVHALVLLAAMAALFVAVGRHPPIEAPGTTVPFIGRWDEVVYRAMDDVRGVVLSGIARALNVIGGGVVTIPLRGVIALWLAIRRRWRAFATWVLTWVAAEVVLSAAKAFFHRGRPPAALVATSGSSFPSGHAVAAAATAVALVLVLLPAGGRRRTWEAAAVAFATLMALSRVYLNAHWLSDVVTGVLLGTGVALGAAALVTEVRHHALRRWPPGGPPAEVVPPVSASPSGPP
ncbi:MAG: phosphatase PAP2 family protein [Candidatus Velamenicoccus archaeovorus]